MKRSIRILVSVLLVAGIMFADPSGRKILQQESPRYPDLAARMSIHGTVKLRVWITPEGAVRRIEYIGGHPLLAESALRSVKAWRFERALKETTDVIEVRF